MTQAERDKLRQGMTQSSNDNRTYSNGNGDRMTFISDNRVNINGKTTYGYSQTNDEKKKWS